MTTSDLEPISPSDAKESYLSERKEDVSYDTLGSIKQGVDLFVDWCDELDIENMNTLTGRQMLEFKEWCKSDTEQNKVSLNGCLSILRRFLVFCVGIEGVDPNLPDKVPIPSVSDDEEVCYDKPTEEEVSKTIQYLEKYEPASRRHVAHAIIKEIGCRVGAERGIDVKDVNLDEKMIKLRHRPVEEPGKKGTPLKNGKDGERNDNISEELADLIRAYLNNPDRHDVTDKFGRKPLLTTETGRPAIATIRRDLYKLTRPCVYTGSCPHDRDIKSCEAENDNHASECPSSHSPHPLRRFSIEAQIDSGVPKDVLADRVDVSVPVLNKHYDTRGKERRRLQRLQDLEKLLDGYGDSDKTLSDDALSSITNEDGMVDPVALRELSRQDQSVGLTNDEIGDDSSNDVNDEVNNETEDENDEKQLSFDDFGEPALTQPALLPALVGVAVGRWVPDRLQRELEEITPATETSPRPSPARAAKGAAAYACFVVMIAASLSFIGILPV